jgi:hypothetical protein
VESKWKNYHIITFPGQSLSKTLEEAMDLLQDRLILELELVWYVGTSVSETHTTCLLLQLRTEAVGGCGLFSDVSI